MEGLIGLAIAIGLIVLAVHYWQITLALAVLGAGVYYLVQENKKTLAREKAEEAERLRHEAEQNSISKNFVELCTRSLGAFEAMPTHLLDAETLLDKAEVDFKERAFAPFWDSIQKATMRLGSFDDNVRVITYDSKQHGVLAQKFDSSPPKFPIVLESVQAMTAANTTADRFNAIVRQAQRDFQFATIYEQRKTNQILVAGFQNLAQAIDGLGDRITSSIDNLTSEVSEMSSSINQSVANLATSVESLHSTTRQEASDQAERHNKALAMLDNIQRRRMPTGFYVNLGTKPLP